MAKTDPRLDPVVESAIQQVLQSAMRHHQAGRLQQAEGLYRQILQQNAKHADALHLLGVLAAQVHRPAMAVDLIRQAIASKPNYPEAHNNLGKALKDMGKLDEAIAAHRQAIALNPNLSEAHNNLGVALVDKGQFDAAIAAHRQAIALNPKLPEAHYNLGVALGKQGRLDEAIVAYRQAIALNPKMPEAHYNLGVVLGDKGLLDEAIGAYRQVIAIKPNHSRSHYNLGVVLGEKGLLEEAIAAYRQAIAHDPTHAKAHSNLGNALKDMGKFDEAIAVHRQAIVLNPHLPEVYSNLGAALGEQGQLEEAISVHRRAIALDPKLPEAHYNLGVTLGYKGQTDEAIAAYRQAIALNPSYADAHNNVGITLWGQGQLDEALTAQRQAVTLEPNDAEAHGNLVITLQCHPGYEARAIAEELGRWNRQHGEPLKKFIQPHANERAPERRLRIGYVSADFRDHVAGRNLMPVFKHINREQFEVFCYADVTKPDGLTEEFRRLAGTFREVTKMTQESLAEQIRADGIDVLVDLALHTMGNRLPVFARKPAPVQVTFAGYPGSTGLTTIDYRLSDPYLDPPGMDESVYSERTVRLPDSFWCYDPLEVGDIAVHALPALEQGVVTFGCLNNFCKVNEGVLAVWARVLRQVEGSRVVLLAPEGSHRQRTVEWLGREGIAPERVEFVGRMARRDYMEQYHRIDLGLDSFPYNGHTTSLDSFWMGVPVVTLVGRTAVGRAGWSQLSNLGLGELAGRTGAEYVGIAVGLAKDWPRLAELRATLRGRMEGSPLMDGARFARNIEAAYRQMWRKWCARGG